MAFLDSSSNMEEFSLRVFLMVTHSVVGALPLGIIITSDETTETLNEAIRLFKASLPANAFYGNGPTRGPKVMMTDNCSELRAALNTQWPETVVVLCIFHILQQVWRWLHDKKNAITMVERPHLLLCFKRVLYSKSQDDMESCFEDLLQDCLVVKYPRFIKYITGVYQDRNLWALCFRDELPMSGNNTNNYCEAQFLVIKDEVLNRQKEVNVVGLVDKLTTELDDH